MKTLIKKYKDIILYLVFGGLTTLVNIVVYWYSNHILNLSVLISTIIAWILSVIFAYITNRTFVFQSKNKNVLKEIIDFFACRLGTGAFDVIFMEVFVTLLGFNDLLIKIISNIVVIVLNYILSKFFIFKKKGD